MFQFRYKTVLKQKRFARDQQAAKVVALRQQLTQLRDEFDQLDAEQHQWMELMTQASKPGILRLPKLLEYRRAISNSTAQKQVIEDEIARLSAELSLMEQDLMTENQSTQAFEKLEEQHRAEYEESEKRIQQRQLDEIATLRDLAKRVA